MGRIQAFVRSSIDRTLYRDLPPLQDAETTEPQLRGVMERMRRRLIGESVISAAVFLAGYGLSVLELWHGSEASQGRVAAGLGIAVVGAVAEVTSVANTWGRHNQYEIEVNERAVREQAALNPEETKPGVYTYEFAPAEEIVDAARAQALQEGASEEDLRLA